MTWSTLPVGQAIEIFPGYFYAVVASVKATHTTADLQAYAAARGLTLVDYAEEGQRAGLGPDPRTPDYRYVAAIGQATLPGKLPWVVPWPLSMFDSSSLVSAWSSLPGTTPPDPTPPTPAALPAPPLPSMAPLAAIGAAAAAASVWSWRRRRRRR